ncbi:hypothetical protein Bca4012_103424 [Brassica carinata]
MKRTLKRESRVLEIVGRKRMGAAMRRSDASGAIRSARSVGSWTRGLKRWPKPGFITPAEASKWAIFGKQNWRCGMNRKRVHGAQLRANLEPTKGVGRLRQQGGGHGSRNPLRSARKSAKWIRNRKRIGSEGWARRSQFEPVDCWRTARAASGEAARRVSAGADWEQLSGVSWASNSQLRTECGQGNPTV